MRCQAPPQTLCGWADPVRGWGLVWALGGCAPQWQQVLERAVSAGEVPGAALVVLQNGELIFEGTAGKDPSTGDPLRPTDRFRVGSLTKTLTSVVVHQLDEEALLSLSDPVVQWVPAAPVTPEATLDDLLRHISGMGDYVDAVGYDEGDTALGVDALFALAGQPSLPRTTLQYSNAGFVAAGLAIEAATGASWEAEARARVLEPLGLGGGFPSDGVAPSGGSENGADTSFHPHAANGRAASAWIASAGEVARFAHALLDSQLLTPETLQRLRTQTVLASGERRTHGAGLDVGWDEEGRFHGHRGASPGYNAMWRHHVEEGLTLVAVINTSDAKAERILFSALDEARGR